MKKKTEQEKAIEENIKLGYMTKRVAKNGEVKLRITEKGKEYMRNLGKN
jgi:hypothetical protein